MIQADERPFPALRFIAADSCSMVTSRSTVVRVVHETMVYRPAGAFIIMV